MSAAETIAAAIEKLEGLKESAATYEVQGEWLVENVGHHTCGAGPGSGAGHEPGCGYEPLTNDPLIVALHRTIDAQIDILRQAQRALDGTASAVAAALETGNRFGPTFALARAILGEAS